MKEKFFKKFEGFNGPFALQMLSVEKINDFAGDKLIKNEFYFYKDNYLTIYIYQEDINRVRNFGIGKLKEDSAYFDNLYKTAISKFDDFKKKEHSFIEEINSISKVKDLKAWIKQFGDYTSDATIIGYMAEMFAGYDNYWLDYVAISKEDFATLTASEEFSFAKEYEYELAKIKLGKSSKTIDDVARKWYWLLNNYFIIDIVDDNKVKEQLDKMTKTEARKIIEDMDNSISEIKNKKENLLKKLGLNDFKINILKTLSEFVVLQDKRKEVVLKTTSIFSKACNKLLDMHGFSQAEKSLILATALYKWFYSLDKEKLLEQSKLASEGLYYPIIGDIMLGRDAINKMEQETDETKDNHANEIKGQVAYRGKINGRAIVVIRNEDFAKFKEGDVLVTSMTRPEFIPLMKKASAFITDEGGITCHAAIVAREMKKPCIIGTKFATQILHDGDLVEVDADNGVVKILERAK